MEVRLETDFYDIHDRHYAKTVMSEVHVHWNGHELDLGERTELEERVSQQFLDILFSIDPESEEFEQRYHYYLNIGSQLEEEGLLPQLGIDGDHPLLDHQFGLGRNLASIWKKHKKVLIVVAAAVIVIAATAGLGAAAAAAGAGGTGISIDDRRRRRSTTPLTSDPTAASMANPIKPLPLFTEVSQLPELLDKSYQPQMYAAATPFPNQELFAARFQDLKSIIPQLYQAPSYLSVEKPHRNQSIHRRNFEQMSKMSVEAGEWHLERGEYTKALDNFDKALELNPHNQVAYLNRGIAEFSVGNFDYSLEDLKCYTTKIDTHPNGIEFVEGFSIGALKGIYHSVSSTVSSSIDLAWYLATTDSLEIGKGLLKIGEGARESFQQLYQTVQREGIGKFKDILVADVCDAIEKWSELPPREQGEAVSFLIAKVGTDIFLPGTLLKGTKITHKAIIEIGDAVKKLQTVKKALFLEQAQADVRLALTYQKMGSALEEFGVASKGVSGLGGTFLEKPPLDLLKGKVIQTGHFSFSLEELSNAGKAIDREGLTKAGRALDKHGNRPGSVFPKATGNQEMKNMQGQAQLDTILNHPESIIKQHNHPKYGNIIDVRIPNDKGVRFSELGEFIMFLEP